MRDRVVLTVVPLLLSSLLLNGAEAAIRHTPELRAGVSQGARSGTQAALAAYIERVKAANAAEVRTPGSLWSENGALTRLAADVKAAHPHDLISILVAESLSASTDGSVKNSRSSSANAQIAGLLGQLAKTNRLQSLLNQNAASGLSAQGQSVTDSSLNTVIGGEVMDVLPNGVLVIEADRQVSFNQQTQLIRMRGLVRPEDVTPLNQVLSTSITDLELEVVGKGIINDYTYRQNPAVR